ncbi:hypothetical protein PDE_08601 [Penicillium oxalicum 114-2]|uniref:Uncharacterized protein n=1 Tax=Penicillium oxalicum (strain 114-2 / CGMCC 5302) TaxID=933388 RepID=S7ZT67_PENO1|nr:hypothetical protein PDE_08601 [Penicillium oxalicum 114-2]
MQESKLRLREHIMNQIPKTITNFFLHTTGLAAIRILGDIPNSILDQTCYLDSIRPFVSKIEESLHDYQPDAQTRFLAVDIYPGKHSYFAVDVNNVDYVYENAHRDSPPIPVYVLRLSRNVKIFRKREIDGTIAERLADMHNGHGNDPLPLVDDHNQMMWYSRPRSLPS